MNLPSYPKIYALGHRNVRDIMKEPVLVQEKVDGSQFSFGVLGGELFCRSKGAEIDVWAPPKMFARTVATIVGLHEAGRLTPEWVYRGEALNRPKHNVLTYDRVPAGNIILFDITIGEQSYLRPDLVYAEADKLNLEMVPVFVVNSGEGDDCDMGSRVNSLSDLAAFMERESCLGGQQLEGVVLKNYLRFGVDGKPLFGKYVREAFKEMHRKTSYKGVPGKDIIDEIVSTLATEARWDKAVIHLAEREELEGSPRDIGALMKEVSMDIMGEEADQIKTALFKWAWKRISRGVTTGLPQWYKDKLAKAQFEQEETDG